LSVDDLWFGSMTDEVRLNANKESNAPPLSKKEKRYRTLVDVIENMPQMLHLPDGINLRVGETDAP